MHAATWKHYVKWKSWSEEATYCMIPFMWNVQNFKSTETEKRLVVEWGCEDVGKWEEGVTVNRYVVSF